jgi:hypothetical protein
MKTKESNKHGLKVINENQMKRVSGGGIVYLNKGQFKGQFHSSVCNSLKLSESEAPAGLSIMKKTCQ